jgi:hypothetical protein
VRCLPGLFWSRHTTCNPHLENLVRPWPLTTAASAAPCPSLQVHVRHMPAGSNSHLGQNWLADLTAAWKEAGLWITRAKVNEPGLSSSHPPLVLPGMRLICNARVLPGMRLMCNATVYVMPSHVVPNVRAKCQQCCTVVAADQPSPACAAEGFTRAQRLCF